MNRLDALFPDSSHVQMLGLECATDEQVWEYCRVNGLIIVTKDDDYSALSVVRGHPPKAIWLQLGNCTTAQVETAFRTHMADIRAFAMADAEGIYVLSGERA